jgi:hypothetical protein
VRSDNQPGWGSGASNDGTDYGGADFGGPMPGGPGSGGRQPWFGPKRIGFGYGPRTWQGYLVTALSLAAVIISGAVAEGKPWFIAVVIVVIAAHLIIIAVQRPRR